MRRFWRSVFSAPEELMWPGMYEFSLATPGRPREFHPQPPTDPCMNLSIHTARVVTRAIKDPQRCRFLPVSRLTRVVFDNPTPSFRARYRHFITGEPTWSYLYRRMIPHFLATGSRVVAPDFFGFGRSDKPADDAIYTFDFHRNSLIAFVQALDLTNITLVVQDWGGLLGLTLPMTMPERFARLIVTNTILPTGDAPLTKGFLDWRAYANSHPDMAVGLLLTRTCPHLSPAEAAAYDAPFPDIRYKGGVRRFPNLVPEFVDSEGAAVGRAAREFWRNEWRGRSVMAIGMKDPVLGPTVMRALHREIRGCPEPLEFADAGHFVQEWGEVVAPAAIAALQA
jgi:haloalkane dehalogenase